LSRSCHFRLQFLAPVVSNLLQLTPGLPTSRMPSGLHFLQGFCSFILRMCPSRLNQPTLITFTISSSLKFIKFMVIPWCFFFHGLYSTLGPWPQIFRFHDYFTDGRTLWTSDQLVARPLPKHRTTQTQNKHIHIPNIHALCGIRIHDPSFRASEDSSFLRPLGYRDRPEILAGAIFQVVVFCLVTLCLVGGYLRFGGTCGFHVWSMFNILRPRWPPSMQPV
jgi:hypothetical protein